MGFGYPIVYLSKKSENPIKWTPKQLQARKKRLLAVQNEVEKNE